MRCDRMIMNDESGRVDADVGNLRYSPSIVSASGLYDWYLLMRDMFMGTNLIHIAINLNSFMASNSDRVYTPGHIYYTGW
jgi:hypothetical protein